MTRFKPIKISVSRLTLGFRVLQLGGALPVVNSHFFTLKLCQHLAYVFFFVPRKFRSNWINIKEDFSRLDVAPSKNPEGTKKY
jgi:hypothetical protein